MTSDRPYREAMPHEMAMDEIEAHSEGQFDPSVVWAFRELMNARPELRHTTPHKMEPEHDEHDDLPEIGESAA
jgi:HD-GYP domain-containing protein (c-di-GMP phosphodiesterase class II)